MFIAMPNMKSTFIMKNIIVLFAISIFRFSTALRLASMLHLYIALQMPLSVYVITNSLLVFILLS